MRYHDKVWCSAVVSHGMAWAQCYGMQPPFIERRYVDSSLVHRLVVSTCSAPGSYQLRPDPTRQDQIRLDSMDTSSAQTRLEEPRVPTHWRMLVHRLSTMEPSCGVQGNPSAVLVTERASSRRLHVCLHLLCGDHFIRRVIADLFHFSADPIP